MLKVSTFLVFIFVLNACVTSKNKETPQVRKVSGAAGEVSLNTWLYSWTNNPLAAQNPNQFVSAQLQFASQCLPKIKASKKTVAGCEGNGMYAGPGLYTCDNPFTSHDYGSTVVMVRAISGLSTFLNHIPESFGEAASVDRDLYGNAKYSAILYDFRASDFNSKALAIRQESLLNSQETSAVTLGASGYKKFRDHGAFSCTRQSTVVDVLNNWGDQIEFMSKTFFSAMDPLGQHYIDPQTQSLNLFGWLAAVSSDAVALSDDQLKKTISTLSSKFPDIAESFAGFNCIETSSVSPRACLASRIYDSARGEMGTDRRPTYAWEFATTLKAFVELGLLNSKDTSQVTDNDQLMALLTKRLQSDPLAAARVLEAHSCMLQIRAGLEQNHLGLWIPPAQ